MGGCGCKRSSSFFFKCIVRQTHDVNGTLLRIVRVRTSVSKKGRDVERINVRTRILLLFFLLMENELSAVSANQQRTKVGNLPIFQTNYDNVQLFRIKYIQQTAE